MWSLLLANALAAPVPIQGALYDGAGLPISGPISATIYVYDAPSGDAAHETSTTLEVNAGSFGTTIDGDLLAPHLRDGDDLWIAIGYDGQTSDRVAVGSAPTALWADAAGELVGDLPWSQVTGAPTRVATGYTGSGPITVNNNAASLGFNLSAIQSDVATIAENAVAGDYLPSAGPATFTGNLTVTGTMQAGNTTLGTLSAGNSSLGTLSAGATTLTSLNASSATLGATTLGATSASAVSSTGTVSSTTLVSSPVTQTGQLRTAAGRWVGDVSPPTWVSMGRLTISAEFGISSLTGDIMIGDDTDLWRRCNLSIHARSQDTMVLDRPLIRWMSDCVGNTSVAASNSGTTDGGVRVVKVADTAGGNKVYEIQVSPINNWPLVTWEMRYDHNNGNYTWEVFSSQQAASAALSSPNTVQSGITRNSQRPYIKLTTNSATLQNGTINATTAGGQFIGFWTVAESRGAISSDADGITIQEPGLYYVGYTLGFNLVSAYSHGWINAAGARVASWSSNTSQYLALGAPVMLNAGARVRLELHNGSLIIDGNPRSLYAIKMD
jgi:hypothetical protein